MSVDVRITDAALELIRAHAAREYPHECCGFLYSVPGAGVVTITVARPALNTSDEDRARRFVIDPQMYLAAEEFADEHGLELAGVYHSHPDHPAEPSPTDLAGALPEFLYLIVSVRKGLPGENRWWLLRENRNSFAELSPRVVADITAVHTVLKGVKTT
ncbi:MAG TPA: M67 family metallopeptidase [candidate division Zixibacteria bacterium]|nr:M67 family metallopeptidase [candidate division Zixibacteria bacterium]